MRMRWLVLCLAAAVPAAASGQELAYSGSFQFSSGSYIFTEPTRTYSFQNGLSLTAGPFRISGSVPVIIQNSNAVTVVGGATLPTGGTGAGAVGGREDGQQVPMGHGGPNRSLLGPEAALLSVVGASVEDAALDSLVEGPGPYETTLGDPFLSSGLTLYSGFGFVRSLDLVSSVKVPLNDLDSGVGTGEWDYGIGASTALAVAGVFVFADATYWHYGDLAELALQDGVTLGGGLAVPVSSRVWISAMGSRSNRIIATAEPASSVSAGISYRTAGGTSWSILAGTGLSETAAGVVVSLGWRVDLGG